MRSNILAAIFFIFKNIFCLLLSMKLIADGTPSLMLGAPGWDPGFFSCFQMVVGCLYEYEKSMHKPQYNGIYVNFKKGLYFEESVGPNWWEYYFEPIIVGDFDAATAIDVGDSEKSLWSTAAISTISRENAGKIIAKYIKLNKRIQEKVDDFVHHYFGNNYVIGIHYRGTDKLSEAPRVDYKTVKKKIAQIIKLYGKQNYVIFVATDEQRFIDYMKNIYKKKLCFCNSLRSSDGKPLHYNQIHKYKQGEEAVIDCYLLSRANIMIRTHSNLSSSAANINPEVMVINLNHATYCAGLRNYGLINSLEKWNCY